MPSSYRHDHVHDDDVGNCFRSSLLHQPQGLLSVGGLGHHLELPGVLQGVPQQVPHN